MATVTISRNSDGKVVFDPPQITLAGNDFVIWVNQDPKAAPDGRHQPTLQGQPADFWMDNSLPPAVEGQPAATTAAIAFGPQIKGTDQNITYACGLHPDEVGTILIPKS